MKIKVININNDAVWRNKFEEYRNSTMINTKIRSDNFTIKRFNIDEQIATFLMVDEDENQIAAVCSLFTPAVWPNEVVRAFNRSYIDPKYRAKGIASTDGVTYTRGNAKLGRFCQKYCYDHIIKISKLNNKKIITATRENSGKSNAINLMFNMILSTDKEWKLTDNYFLTCADKNCSKCWQRLIFRELEVNSKKYLDNIPQLTINEYNNKFINI